MDRHQFAKELIGKAKALQDEVDGLAAKRDYWKRRTPKAVKALLDPPEESQDYDYLTINTGTGGVSAYAVGPAPDPYNQVDDRSLIELAGKICDLRKKRDALKGEVAELKGQDVVGRLRSLLEEPPPKP